jgi:acetyl esterase/lipase
MTICWICAVPTALATTLLILPAPTYSLWTVAVAASELSLWMFLIGLFAGICGIVSYKLGQRGRLTILVNLLCLFVVIVTGRLTIQAFEVAAREGVSLSWTEYIFGAGHGSMPAREWHDVVFESRNPLRLDVYEPRSNRKSYPAIVVIHGGSWRRGKKSDFPQWDHWLAQQGYAVFDIEYRLANQDHPFPAQIIDVRKAVDWIQCHAAEYNVEKSRLALMGRSAGAQLALLAAYTASPTKQAGNNGPVRCVISFYGPTDLTWDYYHPAFPDVIGAQPVLRNYLGGSPDTVPQNYLAASPLQQVTSEACPSLLLHGGHDQIVKNENMDFLTAKLQGAQVSVDYLYLPWANHGFDWNYNGWSSQMARHNIARFLQKYL